MLKKNFIFGLGFLLISLNTAFADPSSPLENEQVPRTDMERIEKDLQNLDTELKQYRIKSLNSEQQAQPYMRDDWNQFTKEIQTSEKDEQRVLEIKKRMDELKEQKQKLTGTPNE